MDSLGRPQGLKVDRVCRSPSLAPKVFLPESQALQAFAHLEHFPGVDCPDIDHPVR